MHRRADEPPPADRPRSPRPPSRRDIAGPADRARNLQNNIRPARGRSRTTCHRPKCSGGSLRSWGNGDLCLFHTDPRRELHSPGLEGGPFFGPIEKDGRCLEQVSSEKSVAPSGYLATSTRLVTPRYEAEIGADCRGRSEAGRVVDRMAERQGGHHSDTRNRIRRRVVSSDFANRRTRRRIYSAAGRYAHESTGAAQSR